MRETRDMQRKIVVEAICRYRDVGIGKRFATCSAARISHLRHYRLFIFEGSNNV